MIGAATQITGFVAAEMTQTTTPQLQSAWFEAQFAPMADLGAALGLLVALIALASAAVRRSPEALAGDARGDRPGGHRDGAGRRADRDRARRSPTRSRARSSRAPRTAFWATVAHAWGTSGFGGFGSSALATLIALVEVFAALFVWLELIVRDAAIYIAVLFFPVALAASIWPALAAWPGRLGRLLLLFVILKPVALIVLSLRRQRRRGRPVVQWRGVGVGRDDPRRGRDLRAGRVRAVGADVPARGGRRERLHGGRSAHGRGRRGRRRDGRSVRTAGGLRNLGGDEGSLGGPGGGAPGGPGSAGAATVTPAVGASPS